MQFAVLFLLFLSTTATVHSIPVSRVRFIERGGYQPTSIPTNTASLMISPVILPKLYSKTTCNAITTAFDQQASSVAMLTSQGESIALSLKVNMDCFTLYHHQSSNTVASLSPILCLYRTPKQNWIASKRATPFWITLSPTPGS